MGDQVKWKREKVSAIVRFNYIETNKGRGDTIRFAALAADESVQAYLLSAVRERIGNNKKRLYEQK